MFGKTLISKILNSIVLVLLLGYAAVKVLPMLGVEPALEIVTKEIVPISKNDLLEIKTLQSKLASFTIDKAKLAKALTKNGSSISEFSKQVHLDFVIPQNLATEKAITLEFITNKPNLKLKSGYKNIAQQLNKYINSPSI